MLFDLALRTSAADVNGYDSWPRIPTELGGRTSCMAPWAALTVLVACISRHIACRFDARNRIEADEATHA